MFNEANSVEEFIINLLCDNQLEKANLVRETTVSYSAVGKPIWDHVSSTKLQRAESDVLIEPELRATLLRLNPEIALNPDYADEVLYRLRAIILSVQTDGLVRANEEFTAWLRGERTMPFGEYNQHTTINLIDFADLGNNRYVVTRQLTYKVGCERRFDIVMFVNGIPLVVGETKTPVRPSVSWVDGAHDIHNDYEVNVPGFFVPNIFSFATEGKTYRYGSVRMPLDIWSPWRETESGLPSGLAEVETAVVSMLNPRTVLDILSDYTLFATDKRRRKIKVICRYQQYDAANQIVDRVVAGRIKKGLIWHFQGSGKSLLMVFAAQKLRMTRELENPTVLIVVDRIDLDTQITATFNAADIPNIETADSREKLRTLLAQDSRKIIITTIHKFGEAPGILNQRSNIIVLVDEAHRTQEGDLGRKMREALPNAFLFGLTGTPINKRDRNTFWAFGADEDEHGYMSRYSFEESIRDNATLPLHFEARLIQLRIDKEAIDEAFANITGHLSEEDQADLASKAATMSRLVKTPERVRAIVADIVSHYRDKVEPDGFKAQVVTFDRESCVLFKNAMDEILAPEASELVMSVSPSETIWKQYNRSKDDEERLLDRFRDPTDPLKFLIVTSRLLTGFDAPILQVMYLDKPMKEHNLLQAICRTNRPYPSKSHGLIVDYLGIFDDVAKALNFDEQSVKDVISNIDDLKDQVPEAMHTCLEYFPNVDRTIAGYDGLIAAQQCLPDNKVRDAFANDYSVLSRLWEALSPDPFMKTYEIDYQWLSKVYESMKPSNGNGKLLWFTLGQKTIELIHRNVHVEGIKDDLETLIMDADVLAEIIAKNDPRKAREVEIRISARLRRHGGDPKFVALGQRLEELRERHEKNLLSSIEFLKQLLQLAEDVLKAERNVDPEEERVSAQAALSDLFKDVRTEKTPVIVENIVRDIDEIVRIVRFPGWQRTTAGEREVKQALRKTLLKYQLHKEQGLFDQAFAYIEQYY